MSAYVTQTAVAPWSEIVQVRSVFRDGLVAWGSGVIVGRNDVMTASHMVYSAADGGEAVSITIFPGLSGTYQPFGAYQSITVQYNPVDLNGDHLLSRSESAVDVAVLGFEQPIGDVTGYMHLDRTFIAGTLNVTGYPGVYGGVWMVNDSDYVSYRGSGTFDVSALDLNPGNSGGPIWYSSGGTSYVVGVVSTGASAADVNWTYSTIQSWMASNDYLTLPLTAGTGGDDHLAGTSVADRIVAGAGNDIVFGDAGADVIFGNRGTDLLVGGAGADTIYGGADNDLVFGETGNDLLAGDNGDDTLYGGADDDYLFGNAGSDRLIGDAGNDTIYGGADGDLLSGEAGNDVLYGNLGSDLMFGGPGADRFVIDAAGSGRDIIADFSHADGDRVQISYSASGMSSFATLINRTADDPAGSAVIDLGNGNSVTLYGVAKASLVATDFLFI